MNDPNSFSRTSSPAATRVLECSPAMNSPRQVDTLAREHRWMLFQPGGLRPIPQDREQCRAQGSNDFQTLKAEERGPLELISHCSGTSSHHRRMTQVEHARHGILGRSGPGEIKTANATPSCPERALTDQAILSGLQ